MSMETRHMGEKIKIEDVEINIFTQGTGEHTLILMAGFGSCSPILDFKLLYTKLVVKFKVVVIEKPGYGFSPISDSPRDVDTVVRQLRLSLKECEIHPPYILCPLSLSGLEALYWIDRHPEEVSGLIGLDMSFSETMKEFKYSVPFLKLSGVFMRSKWARLFPRLAENETMKYGKLSEEEKVLYQELFFEKIMSKDMINEGIHLKDNIETVMSLPVPQVPMLIFVSNGEETGIEKTLYLKIYDEIVSKLHRPKVIHLNCSHFVHIFESERIADEICEFVII